MLKFLLLETGPPYLRGYLSHEAKVWPFAGRPLFLSYFKTLSICPKVFHSVNFTLI